jgi:hypothetical protein
VVSAFNLWFRKDHRLSSRRCLVVPNGQPSGNPRSNGKPDALIFGQHSGQKAASDAVRLLRTYTTQIEALQRYRGKGEQKMTVGMAEGAAGAGTGGPYWRHRAG